MSFYFSARKPLGYMDDMFTPSGGNRPHTAKKVALSADTVVAKQEQPSTHIKGQGRLKPEESGANSEQPRHCKKVLKQQTSQARTPFWSRLLCEPEVFDPYIEAAPMGRGLSLDASWASERDSTTVDGTEDSPKGPPGGTNRRKSNGRCKMMDASDKTVQKNKGAALANRTNDKRTTKDWACDVDLQTVSSQGYPLSATPGTGSASDSSDRTASSSDADQKDGLSKSMNGRVPQLAAKRNVFVVYDTRAAASHSLHNRLNPSQTSVTAASGEEQATTDGSPVAADTVGVPIPLSPHLPADPRPPHRLHAEDSSCPARSLSYFDDATEDYEELEKARMRNLVEKRWQRAEQRKREAKRTREARIAIRQLALEEQQKALLRTKDVNALSNPMSNSLKETETDTRGVLKPSSPLESDGRSDVLATTAVGRSATPPIHATSITTHRLAAADLVAGDARFGRMSSPSASSVEGSFFVDDERVDVHASVEEVLQQRLGRAVAALDPSAPFPCVADESPFPASINVEEAGAAVASPVPLRPFQETAAARAFPLPVKYPLGSRLYLDRVLLAQRSQQVYALMALLTESHRSAWTDYLRLIQLYYYYVNPILSASVGLVSEGENSHSSSQRRDLEESLLAFGSGALRAYHSELRAGAGDYQYLKYRFDQPWRQLFLHVRHYLNLDEEEDLEGSGWMPTSGVTCGTSPNVSLRLSENPSSGEAASPPASPVTASMGGVGDQKAQSISPVEQPVESSPTHPTADASPLGTVCVAATLLHSMELFERYGDLQAAVRDAEGWLSFYYASQTPPHGGSGALSPSTSAIEGGKGSTSDGDKDKDALKVQQPSPYIPMNWFAAQNEATRMSVYWARRRRKLAVMEAAEVKLMRQRRHCNHEQGETMREPQEEVADTDALQPTAAKEAFAAEEKTEVGPLAVETELQPFSVTDLTHRTSWPASRATDGGPALENSDEEEADGADVPRLPPDTYQVVNVGCFGFSFRSLFD